MMFKFQVFIKNDILYGLIDSVYLLPKSVQATFIEALRCSA